jgi:hypothetical protein
MRVPVLESASLHLTAQYPVLRFRFRLQTMSYSMFNMQVCDGGYPSKAQRHPFSNTKQSLTSLLHIIQSSNITSTFLSFIILISRQLPPTLPAVHHDRLSYCTTSEEALMQRIGEILQTASDTRAPYLATRCTSVMLLLEIAYHSSSFI